MFGNLCFFTLSIRKKIIQELFNVNNSAIANKVIVNPQETFAFLLTSEGNISIPKIHSSSITLSNNVKYLGAVIDEKLNFDKHISMLEAKLL